MHVLHLRQFLQQLLHRINTALCMALKQKDKSLGNSTRRGDFLLSGLLCLCLFMPQASSIRFISGDSYVRIAYGD